MTHAWEGYANGARTAPTTASGQQSQASDFANTGLTHSSREAIREHAIRLLANPHKLSPEVIEWAKRSAKW